MSLHEDMQYVGTEAAKDEMAARRVMAKEEEENSLRQERSEQRRLSEGDPNFAMFNWAMYSVDYTKTEFKEMKSYAFAMWRNVYPHIRRTLEDRQKLIDFIKENEGSLIVPTQIREILDRKSSEQMCQDGLQKIADLAKNRSKLNKYGAKAKEIKERTSGE